MENKLTIFISTPDSYSDVFDVFLKCYNKYWFNSPYELVVSTNSMEYKVSKLFRNNKVNDGWIDRAIPVLKDIKTKYVLILCDDIFLTKTPNFNEIDELISIMDLYSINFLRLKKSSKGKKINENIRLSSKKMSYARNLQIGIFNREYLLNQLGNGELNPWQIENRWEMESVNDSRGYYNDIAVISTNLIKFKHGVIKSKWFPSVIKYLKKINIEISSKRPILSIKEELFIIIKEKIGNFFSPRKKYIIKKILKKKGFHFTIEG